MATIKERPDSYCVRGIIKRDFQHSHDGPEEIPHRTKKNQKTKGKVHDHKHLYENNGWEKRYRWHYKDGQYVQDKTLWCLVRPWVCLYCGKIKKVDREYPLGYRSRRYYYSVGYYY